MSLFRLFLLSHLLQIKRHLCAEFIEMGVFGGDSDESAYAMLWRICLTA